MRELVLKMSMSVDGFVAGGRADSDWMFRGGTPDSAAWVIDTLSRAGAHVSGRKLFEGWASLWPTSPSPMAPPINSIPKVVFTRQQAYDPSTLVAESAPASDPASWAATRVMHDLVTDIATLKGEEGGYLLAQGGVEFCRSLVAADLVDEYRFAVLPVALGSGEALFSALPAGHELDLELVSSTAFAGGALGLVYRPRR